MKMYPESVILVQKPYMLRRSINTFLAQYPYDKEIKILSSSEKTSLSDYLNKYTTEQDTIINVMVGDLDRIIHYPELGFMIKDTVPQNVLNSFDYLKEHGYTKTLIK
jgi:uncharacterized SAM-binding protein YcdF (DUF218 family)